MKLPIFQRQSASAPVTGMSATARRAIPTRKLKVINLFGAPGVGKSAVRAGLFWLMKSFHMNVEEVTEYAKQLVLEGTEWQLRDNQMRILADQYHRQLIIARNGYDFAVTDSPLLLPAFYAPADFFKSFSPLAQEAFSAFDNRNFFLHRDLTAPSVCFDDRGRAHDREDSMRISERMRDYLDLHEVPYISLEVSGDTPRDIFKRFNN